MLNAWLHLLAIALYLGSVIGLWAMLLPSVRALTLDQERLKFLARALKLYNPLQIGALGVVVLTGAFQITDLKAAYRGSFTQEIGGTLAIKLTLSFVLIVLSTYQAMGVAHRFVKRYEAGETVSRLEIETTVRRLRVTSAAILILAAPILWLGLHL